MWFRGMLGAMGLDVWMWCCEMFTYGGVGFLGALGGMMRGEGGMFISTRLLFQLYFRYTVYLSLKLPFCRTLAFVPSIVQ